MKCTVCGREFDPLESTKCPYCGTITFTNKQYPNKIAETLNRPIPATNLNLTYLNLVFILFVNLAILAIIGNVCVYNFAGIEVIWCQYAVAGLLMLYLFIKATCVPTKRVLGFIRDAVYIGLFTLNLTQLILWGVAGFGAQYQLWTLGYVIPIAVSVLNLIALIMYLAGKVGTGSFLITMSLNLVTTIYPFVWQFINGAAFDMPSIILIYVAFLFSCLVFVNFLFIRCMSFFGKMKA